MALKKIEESIVNDFKVEDFYDNNLGYERKKTKNHQFINGRLIQTNKKLSQLKESQRNSISEWLYNECEKFYKENKKLPSTSKEKTLIIDTVYKKIEERNIWIPFNEIKQYFNKKQTKINNRIMLL